MRIPAFFFAVVLVLAFTACGQSPEPNGSTPPPPQTPTEAATQPPTAYPTPVLEADASKPTAAATVASTSATPLPEVRYADLEGAIVSGDAERVQHLLQTGVDVTATGPVGNVLPFAIVRSNDEIVRMLLEAGADPNATDIAGRTSLDIAITFDKTEVVRMLANAGADVNEIVSGRLSVGGEDTILGMAVKSGNLEIIRILVDAGADVAAKSDFGQSAMEIAVEGGNANIIEILKSAADRARPPGSPGGLTAIPRGTDIDLSWRAPSEDGGSPVLGYRIEVSEDGSNWEVLLADTGSDDTSYTHTGLEGAGTRHYRVSAINAAGVGPHDSATTEELCGGWDSLHTAILGGQATAIVQCVITELSADVNATDDDGRPMLYWAILVGAPEVVQVLVDAGADANATDDNGTPMLLTAITAGDNPVELVKILVEAGAEVNATDDDGTPMLLAAINAGDKSMELVKILVEAGADVNATDDDGRPMLYWAILEESPEIVRLLVDAGADVNATDASQGVSMLRWAIVNDNPEIVRILEEAGAKQ